jgi:MerR family transcriptional regulator, copper efflux regulator
MDTYSIGQAAKMTGLPAKTIRFYEDEGIITAARMENSYRTYDKTALEELKLLKYARNLGLPLTEIKKLMQGCEKGDCKHSKAFVEKSIDSYLIILNDKLRQMKTLKEKLEEFRGELEENKVDCDKGPYCCNIFHQLIKVSSEKEVI